MFQNVKHQEKAQSEDQPAQTEKTPPPEPAQKTVTAAFLRNGKKRHGAAGHAALFYFIQAAWQMAASRFRSRWHFFRAVREAVASCQAVCNRPKKQAPQTL
jgi:hypothetical protein